MSDTSDLDDSFSLPLPLLKDVRDIAYVLWFDHAKGQREWEKTRYYMVPHIFTGTRTAIHIIRVSADREYYYDKKDYVTCAPPVRLSEKEIMWLLLKVGT